jgi:hypothetical protein
VVQSKSVSCVFKMSIMDNSFLKEQAARCRSLADKADQFTKRRLLDLAEKYEGGMSAPPRASHVIKLPSVSPKDAASEASEARNSATYTG